ncbi:hypothetical protein K438DRAFT_1933088 [Mycena galopus ATCC 62051]|nr:hypothetical protein K438DRAFT_1933088 [Mycena galopus ATCC 62051]
MTHLDSRVSITTHLGIVLWRSGESLLLCHRQGSGGDRSRRVGVSGTENERSRVLTPICARSGCESTSSRERRRLDGGERRRAAGAEQVCDEGNHRTVFSAPRRVSRRHLSTPLLFWLYAAEGASSSYESERARKWTDGAQELATAEGSHIFTVAETDVHDSRHHASRGDETELVVTDACGMALKDEKNGLLGGRVLHARVRTGRPRAYATALDNELHAARPSSTRCYRREGGVEAVRAEGDGDEYRIGNRGSRFDQKKGPANVAWCNLIICTNTAACGGFGGPILPVWGPGVSPAGAMGHPKNCCWPMGQEDLTTPLTRTRLGITFSSV